MPEEDECLLEGEASPMAGAGLLAIVRKLAVRKLREQQKKETV